MTAIKNVTREMKMNNNTIGILGIVISTLTLLILYKTSMQQKEIHDIQAELFKEQLKKLKS